MALDRTQPGLLMKKGRAGTMTHDYKRHGTTTLFAALDVLEGKVIGRFMQRHRHQEFIRFLNAIEAQVPAKKIVHVILDNYERPVEKKTREQAEAIRRARKLARKKMQREGLLPMRPRVVSGAPGRGGPARGPATDRGKRIPGRSARTARSAAQLSTPMRFSPLPSSVGYTNATRGYSFREGQRSNTHHGGFA
jgi:DDE superfamily endonuclease